MKKKCETNSLLQICPNSFIELKQAHNVISTILYKIKMVCSTKSDTY